MLAGDIIGAGELGGIAFADANANGARDADELRRADAIVYLDENDNERRDTDELFTRTESDGRYAFQGLSPGQYVVRQELARGVAQTSPAVHDGIIYAYHSRTRSDTIFKVDASNGNVLDTIESPVSLNTKHIGLAYDGDSLFVASTRQRSFYEIDPATGALLGGGFLSLEFDAAAALGGKLYLSDWPRDQIVEFDLATRTITNRLEVGELNGGVDLTGGMDAIGVRNQLVATTADNHVVYINPHTGVVEASFEHGGSEDVGIAVLGQEVLLSYNGPYTGIVAFGPEGGYHRSFTIRDSSGRVAIAHGMAGYTDSAHRVSLEPGQSVQGLDVGSYDPRGEIRGASFQDANGNGNWDAGEQPHEGVVVYLDLDGNSRLDPAEPRQTTDADGRYVFSDLKPGEYVVREVTAEGYEPTSPQRNVDSLYAYDGDSWPPRVVELDVQTGEVLRQIRSPFYYPNETGVGLAFDGQSLYAISGWQDTVVEFDPETGAWRDYDRLPPGQYDGMTVLNGFLYIADSQRDVILVFDPEADQLVDEIEVGSAIGGIELRGGLGALSGPDTLVATTAEDRFVFIDPQSGVVEGSISHLGGYDAGIATFGNEVLVGYATGYRGAVIWNRDGRWIRNMSTDFWPGALASNRQLEFGHHVTLQPRQTIQNVDFGSQDPRGEIRGAIYRDENENGVWDAGEQPHEGVIAFLDLDDDGDLSPEEPRQTTDAEGRYVFADVMPGEYAVRAVVPERFEPTAPTNTVDRLFAYDSSTWPRRIVELDYQSGEVLKTIPSPYHGSAAVDVGLAFDGEFLFVLNSGVDNSIHQIDPDTGEWLKQGELPAGQYDGVAALDGLVYLADAQQDQLLVFDPQTDQVVDRVAVDGVDLMGGLGSVDDPDALVATTAGDEFVFIDPETGEVVGAISHQGGFDAGVAAIGDEVPIGFAAGYRGIVIWHRGGNWVRNIPLDFTAHALAGGQRSVLHHRVTLQPGQTITDLDFGHVFLNQPPRIELGGPYESDEGEGVVLDASQTTDPDGDSVQLAWDLDGDGRFDDAAGETASLSAQQLVSLGMGDDGTYPVAVRASDGYDVVTALTTLRVENVAPHGAGLRLADGSADRVLPGEAVELELEFADPGSQDTHVVTVDWGDEATETYSLEGERALALSHAYSTGGAFSVRVTVDDLDGGSTQTDLQVLVIGVRTHNGQLQVVGSHERNRVTINAHGGKDKHTITVHTDLVMNGMSPSYDSETINQVRMWLGDGDDRVTLAANVDLPAIIDGETGDDQIIVGGNVLDRGITLLSRFAAQRGHVGPER